MAEPQGALSQMAPAAGMVPTAAGGNTTLSDMLSGVLKQSQDKQSYLQQQRAAYDREMEKYAQQVAQMNTAPEEDAAPWGAMANAASTVAPTWGNMGAMLGRIGGAASEARERSAANKLQAQQQLVKSRQDEVRSLEARDQNVALLKAMTGGAKSTSPIVKVVDGKWMKHDPVTNETTVLSGSQDQIKAKLFQTFFNRAIENEMPNPEVYAQEQTEKALTQFGGTTVTGPSNNIPGVKSAEPAPKISMQITPQEQTKRDAAATRIQGGEQDDSLQPWPKMPTEPAQADPELSKEDAATATRLIARIKANPQAAAKDTATLNNIMQKYENAPALQYLDKPKRKLEEATGAEAGKALGQEHSDLNSAAGASSQMIGQLDLLKRLYQTPNMPEGQLASQLQSVRSGLKTLGMDVGDEVGAADMAASIAGKMALLTRTADGKNLMPGAMSDFEQKILASLVPGLSGTAEGRSALIDVMQQMARARMRFAEEANKMAEANRGILPPDWNTRKQRVMKEEMARMAQLNAQIAKRFQGAK